MTHVQQLPACDRLVGGRPGRLLGYAVANAEEAGPAMDWHGTLYPTPEAARACGQPGDVIVEVRQVQP